MKVNGINVLSLFNGISCGRVALERAGIPVNRYVSYEIDKYANKVAQTNYPNDEYHGDVVTADFTQYRGLDLLIGGSPCQDLSIAQRDRQGLRGERSKLFWEFVRALEEVKPAYFLFENVASMSKADKAIITEVLGVEPILINSALVSAQQRKRLYWTNIPGVEQPEDKGILLRDVLESGFQIKEKSYCLDSHYYKTGHYDPATQSGRRFMVAEPVTDREKSYCVSANEHKGGNLKSYLEDGRRQLVFEPVFEEANYALIEGNDYIITDRAIRQGNESGTRQGKYVYLPTTDKTNTISAGQAHNEKILQPVRIGNIDTTAKDKNSQQYRVYSVRGKSINLCGNGGGMGAKTGLYKIDLPDGDYIIRKLTPIECERLQTLPDNYTVGISNTQRYKCIGNGWTVDVIAHILKYLTGVIPCLQPTGRALSL